MIHLLKDLVALLALAQVVTAKGSWFASKILLQRLPFVGSWRTSSSNKIHHDDGVVGPMSRTTEFSGLDEQLERGKRLVLSIQGGYQEPYLHQQQFHEYENGELLRIVEDSVEDLVRKMEFLHLEND